MDEIELRVNQREILGKKVRFLRRQGITPLHLYGRGIESLALQCDTAGLQRVLAKAGRTQLISLKLDSEKSSRAVVVREVQTEPRTGESLHVDFYQVQMAEQVKVDVPIVLVGEAPVLKQKENRLVHELNALTVECLPDRIPASVAVDLSSLSEPEQTVRVKDIGLDTAVNVLNDPEQVVVRITSRPAELIEEKVVEEVAEDAEAPPLAEEGAREQ